MRRLLVFAIAVAVFGGYAAQADTIAYWDFSEGSGTSANSSVGGWLGTLVNFPDTSPGAGDPEGSSGWTSDGRLNFNNAPAPNNCRVGTDFPLSSLAGSSFTIEYTGTHNLGEQNWSPFIGQSTGGIFFFGKQAGGQQLHYNFDGIGAATGGYVSFSDGDPHHYALVFDDAANTVELLFDHASTYVHTGRTGTLGSSGNLWLGSVSHQPVNEQWNGYIDELRISDAALAPGQMLPAPPPRPAPPPGVAGWWRMEDGSGNIAADSSGNDFVARLRNFADTSAGAGNTTQSGWADNIVTPLTDGGVTLPNSGSLRLDGSNDYVQTTLPVPTGSFTVEAIVDHENAGMFWSPCFGESLASGNSGIFFFGKREGSGAMHYNIDGLGSADIWNVNVADGSPHHIALMFDENRDDLVVFFDHQPVYVRGGVTGMPNPLAGSKLRLGSRDDTHGGEKWDGNVDEAQVWNAVAHPWQMLDGPFGTRLVVGDSFSDDFEMGNLGWAYRENAGGTVQIIPEPGNPANSVLQLVPAENSRAGSAIIQGQAQIKEFDAQFRFRIPAGSGADGFTFGVFDVPYHLGGAGGALGYYDPGLAGQYPSFVVEFDTYQGGSPGETNENHVEVQFNYDINSFIGPSPSDHVPPFDMENGLWTYCRVVMKDGVISVWLNQSGFEFSVADLLIDSEILGDVDLSGNGVFDQFFGYFGLTAGTGGLNDQVIIDDLSIVLIPEPSTLALLGLGALGLLRRRRKA